MGVSSGKQSVRTFSREPSTDLKSLSCVSCISWKPLSKMRIRWVGSTGNGDVKTSVQRRARIIHGERRASARESGREYRPENDVLEDELGNQTGGATASEIWDSSGAG